MKITKIGHCCLLIEVDGKRIMTDPGSFTVADHILENIDIVLITHEHGDHLHVDSLKEILLKNPKLKIITNSAVGKILEEAGIAYEKVEGQADLSIDGIYFEACDAKHVEIFEDYGQVQNTGYFITERLFYPGDAYADPQKAVEILALPVAGPWCRVADVINYAKTIAPKKAFPVHDGLLNDAGIEIQHRVVQTHLEAAGIDFLSLRSGEETEIK
jgi:L-ascorbate metabolism protein UlaG (beta-lactamase superfamily)